MHLSPFHLFIILLLILMIASFARNWGLVEGFVSFNQSTAAITKINVPAYNFVDNRGIIKLYDDIYYDYRNGNAVIVNGTSTSASESLGTTVTSIDVYSRKGGPSARYNTPATTTVSSTGVTTLIEVKQVVDESKVDTIPSMVKEWTIYTADKSQLNYMAWGTNTYLSVFDLSNATLTPVAAVVPSYKICIATGYTGNVTGIQKSYDVVIPMVSQSAYTYADDATVDKDYKEPIYDPSTNLYKFLNNVYYDVKNGNLLMNTSNTTSTKSINVYYRSSSPGFVESGSITPLSGTTQSVEAKTATDRSFTNAQSEPWFIKDSVNNNTIMYWPSGSNTILAAFSNFFVAGKGIPLLKVRRFTNNGVYSDEVVTPPAATPAATTDNSGNDIDDALLDAFSRWYIYFNTSAIGSGNSSDYLLKTQIVPPVCPACPACPNGGGSCINCGGRGGSGTLSGGGSLADVNGPSSGLASIGQSAGSAISGTASALGATALGTGMVAGNVVNNTVNTAGNLAGKTVDAAGNIVNKTFDTAGNIVNKTFDTAGNIVGGTVGTAGNLIQSAGSGVGNLLGLNNPNRFGYDQSYRGPNMSSNTPQQSYMATSGTYNQDSVDNYSRYGALPSKGSSNYRPLTTDFSSFRR
jgi:hypothetical protein